MKSVLKIAKHCLSLLLKKGLLLFFMSAFFLVSCKKEFSFEGDNDFSPINSNQPPVARAGADQTVSLPAENVRLDGSGSTDAENDISSYAWTEISGPVAGTITNASTVQTAITNLVQGTYQFELEVIDGGGLSSKDTVSINVTEVNETVARWTKLHSLPENDFFYGSNHINFLVGVGNKIFAVAKNGSFWVYNTQTDVWTEKGDLPSQMAASNFSVVFSVGNKAYFIGNGTSRQYDVVTDQWTTKNNAPVGVDHVDYSVPLVIGNKAYLVGSTNNLVTVYDPAHDTYTQKNKFPDVAAEAGFVLNEEGYIIQKDGRCWKYDAAADKWVQRAILPPSIFNMSGFSLNNYGYIMGDLNRAANNQGGKLKVWRYDAALDQWKQIDEDYPGNGAYAVKTISANNIVYVGLGYNSGDFDAIDFWSFK